MKQLIVLQEPGEKAEFFQQLENGLYLSNGCKVLLTKNLKPEAGLANGTTGFTMDTIWEESVTDENISDATKSFHWIDFGSDYKGESFFPNIPERRGWFPIFSVLCSNHEAAAGGGGSKGYRTLSRAMIPLKLAWAWTIHKAQGQTIRGKIVLELGDHERTIGLSYVAFSRATKLSNIGIDGGLSRPRLMYVISKKISLQCRIEANKLLDEFGDTTE